MNTHVALCLSHPHPCGYLPERSARELFVHPEDPMDAATGAALLRQGFRRSGGVVYRPHCEHCSACRPLRVPVRAFHPRRSQRRNLKRNRDLHLRVRPAGFDPEHFALYRRYLAARHPDGGMADPTEEEHANFLFAPWADTEVLELRQGDRLLGVAVTDRLPDGLSAVYTYFEPDEASRGLGTRAILMQIERARALGLEHVYLGYWIAECRKMRYKTDFRPFELFDGRRWRRFDRPPPDPTP